MFRKRVFKNVKTQKILSVIFHNLLALIDLKKTYNEELFDYNKIISARQNFWTNEYDYGNTFYGIAHILKKYSNYKKRIRACIEHGVYFGDTVFDFEAINSGMNGLITFGSSRVKHLLPVATVPVIPIGPYIHYAQSLLDENEIKKIKKKNGKTLLVFPTHSIDRVEMLFDFDGFDSEIQSVVKSKNIQHVMVCLFYKDINIGRDKYYIKKGYQVVCNGYRCDPMFLQRLKTFILLSDYTMSNDVGTHVGYCVYLDKPHYVYSQKLSYDAYTTNDMENIMQSDSVRSETQEIRDGFSVVSDNITPRQKEICNKYWGFDYIKTKKEMNKILKQFE